MIAALTDFYTSIHIPLALTLCVSGAIGHIFAIGVLVKMMNPTNMLLISMSCSQLTLCVNYLYSTLYKYGSGTLCMSTLWQRGWTYTLLISVTLSVLVEMCGVFHVVAISIVRYISLQKLKHATSGQPWFTNKRCWQALGIIYGSVLVISGPLYFHSEVVEAEKDMGCVSLYPELEKIVNYRLNYVDNPTLMSVNFWLFGSICKIIPSLILCIMSVLLVGSLRDIQQMQARFASVERDRQHYRTTKIILVIMSIFIIVEFPQGVLAVAQTVTEIPHKDFLGDFFEMLTLFASCLIFALFCSMNSRLRSAFYDLAQKFVDRPLGLFFRRDSEPMKANSSKNDILITESTSAHESHSLVEWTGKDKDSNCPTDVV